MLKNLQIENFRAFRRLTMRDIGRINLIVGANNCGKTTVLEAINILMCHGNLATIWTTLNSRGEVLWVELNEEANTTAKHYELGRFFRRHEIEVGASFQLLADTDTGSVTMLAKIEESRPDQPQSFGTEPSSLESAEDFRPPLTLSLCWSNGALQAFHLPISRRGTISAERISSATRASIDNGLPIRFVMASSLTSEYVPTLFNDIVLTPEEDLVTEALRFIDPAIERIAAAGPETMPSGLRYLRRGGLFVRLAEIKDRVPIASMGDGIWCVLGLALSMVHSVNGILLVDEIDTGLHHTVMEKMWRFLYDAARKYNVQVFATTHSRDCYESLSAICRESVSDYSDVTIQRIERDRKDAVAYSEQEIVAAAKHDSEVR